jgi:hypothetical protein
VSGRKEKKKRRRKCLHTHTYTPEVRELSNGHHTHHSSHHAYLKEADARNEMVIA